jgi:hypothetical protein
VLDVTVLADLKTYLGPSGTKYEDALLLAVIDTETAAQAAKVRSIQPQPADLAEALLRRCQRNLSLRALPLGLTEVSGDSDQRTYVPGTDPEVRRLEGPYRRLTLG